MQVNMPVFSVCMGINASLAWLGKSMGALYMYRIDQPSTHVLILVLEAVQLQPEGTALALLACHTDRAVHGMYQLAR